MLNIKLTAVVSFILAASTSLAQAAPTLMSGEWGVAACEAWNNTPKLADELGESGWAENNGERGHKVLQVYRNDCSSAPTAELRIGFEDGKAKCIYGGAVESSDLDSGVDYIMHGTSEHWNRMGSGKDGPMKAMMMGRLKFKGPKWEAMKNMGPFEGFLLLTGSVEADREICP